MADVPQLWRIEETGIVIPDAPQLIKSSLDVLKAPDALGGDYLFDDDDDMTHGIRVICQQIASVYAFGQAVGASFDVGQATGVMLRDRGSLVAAEYPARSRSVVAGTLFGAAGTIIPVRSILRYSSTGDLWETAQQYVLSAGGTAVAELRAQEYGPVAAAAAPNTSWLIQTPVAGWTSPGGGFTNSVAASLGKLAATDLEVRDAIVLAGRGGAGAATHDTDVQNVAGVEGVSYVALFENRTLIYDPVLDLYEKRARFVVEGGRKQDILDVIATTESTGLNTIDTGVVQGSSTRFDGKTVETSFTRPKDVPIIFRVTLTGAKLPPLAEAKLIVNAAIAARMAEQDVAEPVYPKQYEAPITESFGENVVEDILVEIKRAPGDPYSAAPIFLSALLAERAVVDTAPASAELLGTQEEPLGILAGMDLQLLVDGVGVGVVFGSDLTTAATIAAVIEAQAGSADALDADGRVLVRSETVGLFSTIEVTGGTAAPVLGLSGSDVGTDGDIEVVIT